MPIYTESTQYAEERLARIETRYAYSYSRSWYIRRACDSATRRMTNINKLRVWAEVLEAHGYSDSAHYCRNRLEGLGAGTITVVPRTRLRRTQVPAYVPVAPQNPNASGPSFVEVTIGASAEGEEE